MKKVMKAAVLKSIGKMSVEEVPYPRVRNGSVLIKILTCAVCGSDIRIFNSGNTRVKYPAIIGHEICGEIVEVGRGVRTFKNGDRIAVGADVPCGQCKWCRNDKGNCCDENYAMGYQFPGGFAEFCLLEPMVVKYGPVCRVPKNLLPEHAALAEPLACCINGFERVFFKPGKSLLVIGAGPIGLLLTRLGKALGASKIILGDINEKRLKTVHSSQVDHLIDMNKQDINEKIMDITQGCGVDYAFTACASPEAQEQAVKLVAKRGCINFFGGLPANSSNIQISSNFIHYREMYLTGSHGSTPRQHAMAVDMISKNKVDVSDLITHRFSLDKISDAFYTVRDQKGLKVVILP